MSSEPLPDSAGPLDIAMAQSRADPEPARRLLIDQGRLVRMQIAGERAGFVLKVLIGLAGVIAAACLALLAWEAATTKVLVVRPFSVPPDLAARGLTGEAAAARMLDRLSTLQNETLSLRAPETYSNDWGDDVEIEIPQTGVSIGELQTLLRGWLGEETRITGEIVRLPDRRLSLSVRAGGGGEPPLLGDEAATDTLLAQAAERVYRITQPDRYANYLVQTGKREEAIALFRQLAASGARESRAWAYAHWGTLEEDPARGLDLQQRAIALDPHLPLAAEGSAIAYSALGRDEEALAANRRAAELLSGSRAGDYAPWAARFHQFQRRAAAVEALGDVRGAAELREQGSHPSPDQPPVACQRCGGGALMSAAASYAANRDLPNARRLQSEAADMLGAQFAPYLADYLALITAYADEDWAGVLRLMETPESAARLNALGGGAMARLTGFAPLRTTALARSGRLREAAALIATTPRTCYACVIARAEVFAAAGRAREADLVFAEAARLAPSLPTAHVEQARARLRRGDAAGALNSLREALRRGPRSAEAWKLQGDALARTGRWREAAAAYARATPLAPAWPALRQARAEAERRAGGARRS